LKTKSKNPLDINDLMSIITLIFPTQHTQQHTTPFFSHNTQASCEKKNKNKNQNCDALCAGGASVVDVLGAHDSVVENASGGEHA